MPHKPKLNFLFSCLLLFLAGSSYALSIFSNAMSLYASNPQLGDTWSSSMALLSLLSAPATLLTGSYLDAGKPQAVSLPFGQSKTHRVRIGCLLAALSYSTLSLAALGVLQSSTMYLRIAMSLQSIPLGIFYIMGIELLAAWMPEKIGFAIGCGQMAFGFGPIVSSSLFHSFIHSFGIVNALYASSAFFTALALLSAAFLEWPSSQPVGQDGPRLQGVKLPFSRLVLQSPFWLYMVVLFITQVVFPFYPYFFTIGVTFGKSMDSLVKSFQLANLLGTFSRLIAGTLADHMGCGWGPFYSGAKNMMLILLTVQTTAFLSLISFSNQNNFSGYIVTVQILFVIFGAVCCDAIALARDLFGLANSAVIVGIGVGLMMGSGEASSCALMSVIHAFTSGEKGREPSSYNLFYLICAAMSLFGFLCCLCIERCEEAFEIPCSHGIKAVLVDNSLVTVPTASHPARMEESKAWDIPGGGEEAAFSKCDVTRVRSYSFRTPSYIAVQRIDDDECSASPFGNMVGFVTESMFPQTV